MPEGHITQSDIEEGLQLGQEALLHGAGLFLFSCGGEEFNGIGHRHVEDVGNVSAVPFDIQDFVLEATAFAHVAPQFQIGHELHADGHLAFALARLASAAGYVEAKVGRFVAARLGDACAAEQLPDLVVRFDVRDWIASGRFANGVLVDELQGANFVHTTR